MNKLEEVYSTLRGQEIIKDNSSELFEFIKNFGFHGLREAEKDAENLLLDYPNQEDEFYLNLINGTSYFDTDETNAKDLVYYQDMVYSILSWEMPRIIDKIYDEFDQDMDE